MRSDDNSRTEHDAARFAAIAGASEHDADAIQPPVLTPYCSVCQRGTKGYVCGPCARDGGGLLVSLDCPVCGEVMHGGRCVE